MKDYGMLFEKTICKYLEAPRTPISYSGYYGDNFTTRALLFTICVRELNTNFEKYNEVEIETLKAFERNLKDEKTSYDEITKIIEFLTEK